MFNYITSASGEDFIKTTAQYAVKSLLATGVDSDNVHVAVNSSVDKSLFKKLIPGLKNIHVLKVDENKYKWGYMKGKRRYATLKPISILRVFPEGDSKPIVQFDGDVLWYKDPTPFLLSKSETTWFHHGKGLEKRATRGDNIIHRHEVNMEDIKSLSNWCRYAFAFLLIKYKVKKLPEREVNSGFYILHPNDHCDVPLCDLEGCNILANNKKLKKDGSAGEQCPLNAALCILETKWKGGSRFLCLEHEDYFEHFFGANEWKVKFRSKIKKLGMK